MEKNFNLYSENKLELNHLREKLKNFKDILKNQQIIENKCFKLWEKDYLKIYNKNHVQIDLYLYLCLIYFIGHVLIAKFFFKKKINLVEKKNSPNYFLKIEKELQEFDIKCKIFELKYFKPLLDLNQKDFNRFCSLISKTLYLLEKLAIDPEYYFDFIFQSIIPKKIRHNTGEFYTPPFLARKMIDFSYKLGERVLDPCCGSGNFLIIILKTILNSNLSNEEKISAINNIYGFDINPVSVYMAKINFLLLLDEKYAKIKINIYNIDSLHPDSSFINEKFDLIIGNPPWYTFKDIDSLKKQESIKILAEKLEIKPTPKNLLNTEISTIFFYHSNEVYMNNNSKIFFVMTKGVITGSHTSKFRNFNRFNSLQIWKFDNHFKSLFKIDFICIFAKKTNKNYKRRKLEIPCFKFTIEDNFKDFHYFENLTLNIKSKDILIPYNIKQYEERLHTKKLITESKFRKLIAIKESTYKNLFHKGADLNPRNLIFVDSKSTGNSLVRINPDERVFKRAKYPWKNKEFKNEIVEQSNIFKAIKSTELVKFFIYDYYNVFLPLSKTDLSFNYGALHKNSQSFYKKINEIYLKLKKITTNNQSLMENLNRWGKLINLRQIGEIKVVYNNSGSILKSAVIQGDYIISGDLSYYTTLDLDEAYYLSAILNSPLITEQIRIIKSSRHIFKKPFNFPIKRFNPHKKYHQILVNLGKEGEKSAQIVKNNLLKKKKIISKFLFKEELNRKISQTLNEIDKIVKLELSS